MTRMDRPAVPSACLQRHIWRWRSGSSLSLGALPVECRGSRMQLRPRRSGGRGRSTAAVTALRRNLLVRLASLLYTVAGAATVRAIATPLAGEGVPGLRHRRCATGTPTEDPGRSTGSSTSRVTGIMRERTSPW